ncbi:MAG: TonB-dependent receptor [Planctomycetes bacterium]|nr:TonB-dependent receptor [Planctomycetota bacterium]
MIRFLTLVPSLCFMSQCLLAEEVGTPAPVIPDNPVESDEIEITATRLSENIADQPYAIYRLDADGIAFRNSRTLIDSLHATPGVAIQRTAPNQASPFIRGLTGEQTLLMFDGVRFNHAMMRPGPNQYAALMPDKSVENVDVILGSASTVLGSDGLTGALDFRLRAAGGDTADGIGGYADLRVGAADSGGSLAAGLEGRHEDWAWTAETQLQNYDNLIAGKDSAKNHFGSAANQTEVPHTAYDQQSFNTRFLHDGMEDHTFTFAVGTVQQNDASRPDGYFENTNDSDRISRYFPQQDFTYMHGRHFWTPQSESVAEIQTTLWLHEFAEEQVRERLGSSGTQYRRQQYQDTITTLGLDVQVRHRIGEHHDMTSGFTFFVDNTDNAYQDFNSPDTNAANATQSVLNKDQENAGASVPDDSEYEGLGVFTQDNWHIDEQWSLLAGLRYSRYAWQADVTDRNFAVNVIDNSVDAFTANIRSAWDHDQNWHVFAGISQGFRAPNLKNLVGADGVASGSDFAGNPDLDPERSLSYEVGLRYEFVDDHQSYAALNIFYTSIEDIIQRVYIDVDNDTILDPVVVNGEDALLKGFELHFNVALPYLEDHGILSCYSVNNYVDGEEQVPQSDGSFVTDNISRANRLFGVIGVKFAHLSQWWTATQIRWSDAYSDVAVSDAGDLRLTVPGNPNGSLPGYAVFDIKAGWSNADETQTYNLALENIGNKTYRDIGSGADATGFNLVLAAKLKF